MCETGGMLLLRVELPDVPGSLGAVASAMGTVDADIMAVEFVEKHNGFVIDDFMLDLPAGVMKDSLVSACTALPGVKVLWLSSYPESWGLESDVELLNRMSDEPEQAAELLAQSAPVVFHCHWALLLDGTAPSFATAMAPDLGDADVAQFGDLSTTHAVELAAGWLPSWGDTTVAVSPLSGGRCIVLGRQGGPDWLKSELYRLRFLASTS